jgi:hypothetical protein
MKHRLRELTDRVRRGGGAPAFQLLNLSFVLHERSTSAAVQQYARSSSRHRSRINSIQIAHVPATVSGDRSPGCHIVLTAHLGAHELLGRALSYPDDTIARIDAFSPSYAEHIFFGSDAQLALPDETPRSVMVAALLFRPGNRSTHLSIEGIFDWPSQRNAAVSAIEDLIQSYADQWSAPRALWRAPAEELLPDEIR